MHYTHQRLRLAINNLNNQIGLTMQNCKLFIYALVLYKFGVVNTKSKSMRIIFYD